MTPCRPMDLPARHSLSRRTPAQPSRPSVPKMKPQTMILSLLLSRWKHSVRTSSSSASLQKSMPWLRQKALVHSEHDVDAERAAAWPCRRWWSTGSCGASWCRRGAARRMLSWNSELGERSTVDDSDWCSGPRGMMVLFLKHVHLQNVGAADR